MTIKTKLLRAAAATLCAAALTQAPSTLAKGRETKTLELKEPLSGAGAINLWVYVDKIPFPNGEKDIKETLKHDLLPNEKTLAPIGGEKFVFDNHTYKWGVVKLIDGYYELVHDAWKGGKALDYSSAYLFCRLVSKTKQNVTLILRSDDSPKVYLNGTLVFSKYCQRGVWHKKSQGGEDSITLHLEKGENNLLLRVDNYRFAAGVYCRLLDAEGNPAKGVDTSVKALKRENVWNYKNSYANPYVYLRTPPVLDEPFEAYYGSRVQRVMTLLATSGPKKRNKVKILFYGQSIVAEGWHKIVLRELRERYPYAIIESENRAIGGHTAPTLVRCATQDLYPFYPDLVVFHVYGGMESGEQERIFHNIRKYTTAEIMTFSHHFSNFPNSHDAQEEFESSQYKYLAQKYNCEFVDVRAAWAKYLKRYNMDRSELLADGIHHNGMGKTVLANIILKHFKLNTLNPGGWYKRIKTYEARRFFEEKRDELQFAGQSWRSVGHGHGVVGSRAGDSLKLEFTGNRLDVTMPREISKHKLGTAKVLIDGKAPSEIPSIYVATRPSLDFKKSRPAIKRVFVDDNPIKEEWTFRITKVNPKNCRDFSYELVGSITGFDGKGDSKHSFVSNSGRIRLEPRDLFPFANLHKPSDGMVGFEIKWKVLPQGVDIWRPRKVDDASLPNSQTLAQGLTNGKHTLEIILDGDGEVPIKELTVYEPLLK